MKHAFLKFLTPIIRIALKSWLRKLPLAKEIYHWSLRPFIPDIILFSIEVEGVGMKISVPKNDTMFLELQIEGKHEEEISKAFKHMLTDGMSVVDVGANFGYFSILAAKMVGENGKVFAFEPHPFTYKLLCKNIELNRLNNVVPVQKAVSNETGATRLWTASTLEESNIINAGNKNPILVQSTTLDEFFKDFPSSINLLKIDVEGAEVLVVQGMKKIMADNKNLNMIVEFHPGQIVASGHSLEEFWTELQQNGFWPPFLLDENGEFIKFNTQRPLENQKGKRTHLFFGKNAFK